jgi:hypothetical protein
MILVDQLRFHWPVLMVLAFLLLGGERIRAKVEFCVFGMLVLYGISRLVEADLLTTFMGLWPNSISIPGLTFELLHGIFQVGAAICGAFALLMLNRALTPALPSQQ